MRCYYNHRELMYDDKQLECVGQILIFTGSIIISYSLKIRYLESSSLLEDLFEWVEKQLFEVVVLRKYTIFAIFTIYLETMFIALWVLFFEGVHIALQFLLSRRIIDVHHVFNVLSSITNCYLLWLWSHWMVSLPIPWHSLLCRLVCRG